MSLASTPPSRDLVSRCHYCSFPVDYRIGDIAQGTSGFCSGTSRVSRASETSSFVSAGSHSKHRTSPFRCAIVSLHSFRFCRRAWTRTRIHRSASSAEWIWRSNRLDEGPMGRLDVRIPHYKPNEMVIEGAFNGSGGGEPHSTPPPFMITMKKGIWQQSRE